ncbi:MAG: ribose-5-phosphate isomerase RpiA [candidate division KSB1 bacterium]|nr:ribose-5-phosphate isomerase RpiA [candidate division KSB1 bacterium]MDZ7272615.1 ribose-5-phosphate isomerase RpiA [candidate division KSB1 bacterium]MDZ7284362.1 ribose-5-phosphate isomerase RpiA [candidate division KSB1 bacterium]MDZ7297242.1 ribose-5-phosphate isomerase RpiA [candidate division KSB1 bacterium]MDZ7308309.1 ribose-5-phosphate isomerase RpiA [candidate division KSB1 bacterium]
MPRLSTDLQKQNAALAAVQYVENRMIVGLGTGSTTALALHALRDKIKKGLRITGVPSSTATAQLAKRLGIPLRNDAAGFQKIDLTIDGADEVDPDCNLIKGGGGALTREKIIATRSDRVIIIVNEKKLVPRLGRFRLPVEVLPFGWQSTAAILRSTGCKTLLRGSPAKPFRTDNGNFIIDCAFGEIAEPEKLLPLLKSIVGVVEVGLFVGIADLVIVGKRDGSVEERWAA